MARGIKGPPNAINSRNVKGAVSSRKPKGTVSSRNVKGAVSSRKVPKAISERTVKTQSTLNAGAQSLKQTLQGHPSPNAQRLLQAILKSENGGNV